MKVLWVISLIWIQVGLAQINPALLNGLVYQQNLPANNILLNQRPINNAVNRLPIGNVPITQTSNVQNLPLSNIGTNNLQLVNGLANLPASNRLTNLPQQSLPVSKCNCRNQQLNLPNDIQLQNYYGNLAGNLQSNNLPLNNLPSNNLRVNNVQLNNLPVSNLPISNNYQVNNLPVSNLPAGNNLQLQNNLNSLLNNYAFANTAQTNLVNPNLSGFNNLQANNLLTSANVQIPNNIQVPLLNNALLYNNAPLNSLISSSYQQNIPNRNNLQLSNVPVNYNLPNNLPVPNYNLANAANTNYLTNLNGLQSNPALVNNLQLINQPIGNNIQNGNRMPVNNNFYNSISNVPNIGQTLPLPLPSVGTPNSQLTVSNPSIGNNCGCKSNSLFLLDDNVANSLPSTPVLSLNGLQLGQLGKLPLFNGLPVIGMTESIVNLQPL